MKKLLITLFTVTALLLYCMPVTAYTSSSAGSSIPVVSNGSLSEEITDSWNSYTNMKLCGVRITMYTVSPSVSDKISASDDPLSFFTTPDKRNQNLSVISDNGMKNTFYVLGNDVTDGYFPYGYYAKNTNSELFCPSSPTFIRGLDGDYFDFFGTQLSDLEAQGRILHSDALLSLFDSDVFTNPATADFIFNYSGDSEGLSNKIQSFYTADVYSMMCEKLSIHLGTQSTNSIKSSGVYFYVEPMMGFNFRLNNECFTPEIFCTPVDLAYIGKYSPELLNTTSIKAMPFMSAINSNGFAGNGSSGSGNSLAEVCDSVLNKGYGAFPVYASNNTFRVLDTAWEQPPSLPVYDFNNLLGYASIPQYDWKCIQDLMNYCKGLTTILTTEGLSLASLINREDDVELLHSFASQDIGQPNSDRRSSYASQYSSIWQSVCDYYDRIYLDPQDVCKRNSSIEPASVVSYYGRKTCNEQLGTIGTTMNLTESAIFYEADNGSEIFNDAVSGFGKKLINLSIGEILRNPYKYAVNTSLTSGLISTDDLQPPVITVLDETTCGKYTSTLTLKGSLWTEIKDRYNYLVNATAVSPKEEGPNATNAHQYVVDCYDYTMHKAEWQTQYNSIDNLIAEQNNIIAKNTDEYNALFNAQQEAVNNYNTNPTPETENAYIAADAELRINGAVNQEAIAQATTEINNLNAQKIEYQNKLNQSFDTAELCKRISAGWEEIINSYADKKIISNNHYVVGENNLATRNSYMLPLGMHSVQIDFNGSRVGLPIQSSTFDLGSAKDSATTIFNKAQSVLAPIRVYKSSSAIASQENITEGYVNPNSCIDTICVKDLLLYPYSYVLYRNSYGYDSINANDVISLKSWEYSKFLSLPIDTTECFKRGGTTGLLPTDIIGNNYNLLYILTDSVGTIIKRDLTKDTTPKQSPSNNGFVANQSSTANFKLKGKDSAIQNNIYTLKDISLTEDGIPSSPTVSTSLFGDALTKTYTDGKVKYDMFSKQGMRRMFIPYNFGTWTFRPSFYMSTYSGSNVQLSNTKPVLGGKLNKPASPMLFSADTMSKTLSVPVYADITYDGYSKLSASYSTDSEDKVYTQTTGIPVVKAGQTINLTAVSGTGSSQKNISNLIFNYYIITGPNGKSFDGLIEASADTQSLDTIRSQVSELCTGLQHTAVSFAGSASVFDNDKFLTMKKDTTAQDSSEVSYTSNSTSVSSKENIYVLASLFSGDVTKSGYSDDYCEQAQDAVRRLMSVNYNGWYYEDFDLLEVHNFQIVVTYNTSANVTLSKNDSDSVTPRDSLLLNNIDKLQQSWNDYFQTTGFSGLTTNWFMPYVDLTDVPSSPLLTKGLSDGQTYNTMCGSISPYSVRGVISDN